MKWLFARFRAWYTMAEEGRNKEVRVKFTKDDIIGFITLFVPLLLLVGMAIVVVVKAAGN